MIDSRAEAVSPNPPTPLHLLHEDYRSFSVNVNRIKTASSSSSSSVLVSSGFSSVYHEQSHPPPRLLLPAVAPVLLALFLLLCDHHHIPAREVPSQLLSQLLKCAAVVHSPITRLPSAASLLHD